MILKECSLTYQAHYAIRRVDDFIFKLSQVLIILIVFSLALVGGGGGKINRIFPKLKKLLNFPDNDFGSKVKFNELYTGDRCLDQQYLPSIRG